MGQASTDSATGVVLPVFAAWAREVARRRQVLSTQPLLRTHRDFPSSYVS
jgi:hypothetical protein